MEEIPLKIVQCYGWDEGEILLLLEEYILTDATPLLMLHRYTNDSALSALRT